jgi:hypothetical protein
LLVGAVIGGRQRHCHIKHRHIVSETGAANV